MVKILIAEDVEVIRKYYKKTLETDPEFIVVGEASTGKESVLLYNQLNPDIVLMDIEMEDSEDGIKAATTILKKHPKGKILYLTCQEGDDIVVKALSNGAIDYIVKSCDKETLLKKVRDAVNGHSTLSPTIQKVVMGEYLRLRKSEQNLLYFIHNLGDLTPTEKELIAMLLKGLKIREIAEARGVEVVTVKSQIHTLLQKFKVTRYKEVVKNIHELGLEHLFIKE